MAGDTGPSQEEQLLAQAEAEKRRKDLEAQAQARADQQAAAQAAMDQRNAPADDLGNNLLSKKKKASQLATGYNQGTLLQ